MAIKVRAKTRGYYDNALHEPGTKSEEFFIRSEEELGKWMERLDAAPQPDQAKADDGADKAAGKKGAKGKAGREQSSEAKADDGADKADKSVI